MELNHEKKLPDPQSYIEMAFRQLKEAYGNLDENPFRLTSRAMVGGPE